MKNRLGWLLAMLAILTFSLGQEGAAAGQIVAARSAAAVVSRSAAAVVGQAAAPVAAPSVLAPALLNAPTSATDPTKVPHYFGPYPNWANSPQVLADAIVTITSTGTGTGAAATAKVDPTTGAITEYTVTSPGSGYTSVPTVTITAPGALAAAGATATAVVSSGVLRSIAVTAAGSGFTAPSVAITAGGSPTTNAVAQASGGVDGLAITAGGSAYKIKPIVHFGFPDAAYCFAVPAPAIPCEAPTATATMDAAGVVTAVAVTTPGSGYTKAPVVDIWDGPAVIGTAAAVVAKIAVGRVDVITDAGGTLSANLV